MIVEGHEVTAEYYGSAHTVVVGSGAGGAVTAAILAEAGVDVVLLEEGGNHGARDFNQRQDEMYRKLYRGGGTQLTEDGMINVLQGSTLGGSTVINMSDVVPTPPEVYGHWNRILGITEINENALASSQARVLASLETNRIGEDLVNENNRLLLDAAAARGYSAGTFDHNRVNCRQSGYCLIGCSYDAKKGCHLTYIPRADSAGARIHTDVRIHKLEIFYSGKIRVIGKVVDRVTRTARFPFEIECERVVLAAGAVHTPAIIYKSRLMSGLEQLGRNVSLQPQMVVLAGFDSSRSIIPWRGIPQSVYVDEFDDNDVEHGLGGFRMEGVYGSVAHVASDLAGFGQAHKRLMLEVERVAGALVLVPDQPSGHMTWEFSKKYGFMPKVRYELGEEWKERMRSGLRKTAELYFEAGARWVAFSCSDFPILTGPDDLDRIDDFPFTPGATNLISAHVQGTCRMGLDARTSVVDQDHRLHTVKNIYVVDASVMPTSSSTHTMVPVMTMADRAAHRMLKD